jgi:hypothetical protein
MPESGFAACSSPPLSHFRLAHPNCTRSCIRLGPLTTTFHTPAVATLPPSKTHRLSHAVQSN